ncbi:hypothetical protein FRC12_017682 [Ceratobasidium sp. 428]|nr:hypothetical protein FRC12_017682 [Ceratobasidium sp. 428]
MLGPRSWVRVFVLVLVTIFPVCVLGSAPIFSFPSVPTSRTLAAWIDDGQKVVSWTLCRRTPPFSRSKLAWYGYSALHRMRRGLCRPRPPAHASFPTPVSHSLSASPPASRTKGGSLLPTRTRLTTTDYPAPPEPAYHRTVGRSCRFGEATKPSGLFPSAHSNSRQRNSFGFGIKWWLLHLCMVFRHMVVLLGRAEDSLVDLKHRIARWSGFSRVAADEALCVLYGHGLLAGCILLKLTIRSISLSIWEDILLFDEPETWTKRRWVRYTYDIQIRGQRPPSQRNVELNHTLKLECPLQCRHGLEMDAWYRIDAVIELVKWNMRHDYGPIIGIEVLIKKDWALYDIHKTKFGVFEIETKREGFDGIECFVSERHFMLNMPDHISLDDEWEVMHDAQFDRQSQASSAILPYDLRPQPELPLPRVLAPPDMRDEWREEREERDDMRWRLGAFA